MLELDCSRTAEGTAFADEKNVLLARDNLGHSGLAKEKLLTVEKFNGFPICIVAGLKVAHLKGNDLTQAARRVNIMQKLFF